ncbi:MAG: heavy-metal-associated domain-containing protein [Chloroflexi bacterium]|nr:MAG: heavy-metal-associated domain-containing protein [Chloroflexota bacterium]
MTVVASSNDEVTVNVLELICQSCAEHIVASCRQVEGVVSVKADRKEKLITLHFDSSLTTRERILAAVDDVVASIPCVPLVSREVRIHRTSIGARRVGRP